MFRKVINFTIIVYSKQWEFPFYKREFVSMTFLKWVEKKS